MPLMKILKGSELYKLEENQWILNYLHVVLVKFDTAHQELSSFVKFHEANIFTAVKFTTQA